MPRRPPPPRRVARTPPPSPPPAAAPEFARAVTPPPALPPHVNTLREEHDAAVRASESDLIRRVGLPGVRDNFDDMRRALPVSFEHTAEYRRFRGYLLPPMSADEHYGVLRRCWRTVQTRFPFATMDTLVPRLRFPISGEPDEDVFIYGEAPAEHFRFLAGTAFEQDVRRALAEYLPEHARRMEGLLLRLLEAWGSFHTRCAGAGLIQGDLERITAALTRWEAGDADRVPHNELLRAGYRIFNWLREHEVEQSRAADAEAAARMEVVALPQGAAAADGSDTEDDAPEDPHVGVSMEELHAWLGARRDRLWPAAEYRFEYRPSAGVPPPDPPSPLHRR